MSHIITSNEDIKLISDQLDILRTRGYSKNSLYELLNYIIPQNEEYQVIPRISETGLPGYFSGYERLIHISEEGLKKYIKNDVKVCTEIYPYLKKHEQELFYYLTLFVLTHEVEHAYQYMIGKEYIDFPYQLVIDAYKHITDFSSYYKYPQIITQLLIERYKIKKIIQDLY